MHWTEVNRGRVGIFPPRCSGIKINVYSCLAILVLWGALLSAQPHSIFPPTTEYNEYLHQDENGFIWTSSLKGWYRTDGSNFHFLGVAEDDPNGYDRYVQSRIYPDDEGGLWYTGYNGLHRIDEATEVLTSYRLPGKQDSILVGYRAFFIDHSHKELWLKVGERIVIFDLKSGVFRETGLDSNDYEFAVRTFPDGSPEIIIGCPWLNGPGFQVMRRKTPTGTWGVQQVLFPEVGEDHFVSCAVLTGGEEVILGTSDGLATYNFASGQLKLQKVDPALQTSGNPVGCMRKDSLKKRLYISEAKGGFWEVGLHEDGTVNWTIKKNISQFERPWQVNEDRHKNIWVNDLNGGIHRLDLSIPIFIAHELPVDIVDLKVGPDKSAYGLSTLGLLYPLGTEHDGEISLGSTIKNFTALAFSRRDWWGISPTEVRRRPFFEEGNPQVISPPDMTRKIMAVHESGDIVVSGTRGVYLNNTGGNNGFHRPPEFNDIEGWDISFLHYTPGGLLITQFEAKEIRAYDWQPDSLALRYRILLNSQMLSFANGNNKDSGWAGTYEGLFEITNGTAQKVVLNSRQSLNPEVKTIIPLADTALLLGTDAGLLIHHIKNGTTQKYTEKDGLPSHNFRPGAGGIDRNGICWLLIDGKVISFDPDKLLANKPQLPRAYLGGIWVNDIPLDNVPTTGQETPLEFPYWKNDLRFSVMNVGFDRPEDTRVSLRLIGRDSTWQTVEPGIPVPFSNLPPGEYRLEMESISKNGFLQRSEPVALTITPAWYDLWYIRLLIVAGLIGIGIGLNWLIVRNRIAKLEREHRRRQAISDERMRIARRLHDDLGGDLTSLMSVISTQRYLEEEGQTDQPLDLASLEEQVKDANTNMREIVWAIDDKKGTFHHLAEELTKLVKLHPARTWKPVVEFPRTLPDFVFSPEQKLNIYLIFKEGVQNIVKHAPNASLCRLDVRIENSPGPSLKIELSDDGPGPFPKASGTEKTAISGFGVENMQHRAAAIGGTLALTERSPHGTSLRLLLPLEVIELGGSG